ncbi:MAG: type II toxin-antitoxin system HicA family toxin [Planctomycetes bacterium]|nr:type II toxin-antitoxin system HicA family toxin [Planctomycetota bacterium]
MYSLAYTLSVDIIYINGVDINMFKEERFKNVRKKLENKGYELTRISGSHHIFTKKGCNPVSIPVHKATVKPYYVRQVDKL